MGAIHQEEIDEDFCYCRIKRSANLLHKEEETKLGKKANKNNQSSWNQPKADKLRHSFLKFSRSSDKDSTWFQISRYKYVQRINGNWIKKVKIWYQLLNT